MIVVKPWISFSIEISDSLALLLRNLPIDCHGAIHGPDTVVSHQREERCISKLKGFDKILGFEVVETILT